METRYFVDNFGITVFCLPLQWGDTNAKIVPNWYKLLQVLERLYQSKRRTEEGSCEDWGGYSFAQDW